MSEEIKFDHFKDINELLEHIDLWYREDDIEYTRWFGLEDLHILKIYITSLQYKVEQKDKEIDRLNNIINELEEYIKPYLYMLNGIQDRDIYEQCQLDDFTDIMEKLQELKENNNE